MIIALDAMGGDYAPVETVAGAVKWTEQSHDSKILLVGKQEILEKELEAYQYNKEKIQIVNASQIVEMNEAPAVAMRKKKDSSIVVANKLVKEGKADAVVSCGSTGAQMAAAIFVLGRMENIERPSIVTMVPRSEGKYNLLIDVGANVDCRPQQLLQFALLGRVYASILMGIDNPKVGLLNNGEEESKGNSLAVETYKILKEQTNINFIGNVEGRDIFSGKSDVVVCDGFTGNILLKGLEGMAAFIASACVKETGTIPKIFKQFDPGQVGGAPLLGVNGVSIVCHGSSKREAVFNGIRLACECVDEQIIERQKLALSQSL